MKNIFFSDISPLGDVRVIPSAVTRAGEVRAEYEESFGKDSLHLHAKTDTFSDDIYVRKIDTGYRARRIFKNVSTDVIELRELGFSISGINFAAEQSRDYYYHAENPRLFDRFIALVDQDRLKIGSLETEYDETAGNKWVDPGVLSERVGASPYQPFPAIMLSNLDVDFGVVHGTLSQDVFYHAYLPRHENGTLTLNVYSAFKDIGYREVAPEESLVDEWYLGVTERAHELEHLFDGYSAELRRVLPANYGATDINRKSLIWGTWNDGISRKVNEQLIFEEAEALLKYFPNVEWLQVDDGYCAFESELGFKAHGLGVPYEGEAGVDKVKFPHGMRYVSDRLREMGLRPAIWIGGYCPRDTKISVERRDLMCEYNSRNKRCYVLDVSNPDTREYMTGALDTIIYDWGFEGVKHDFWSYAFEVSEDLLANKNRSGYEHRHWWLDEVRKRLSGDGYFQTGCDIVMGNPFLGTHFTNYRYGIDIGAGAWKNFRKNYIWCMACLATHTGDLFVPNSDAVGMFPGFDDTDATFAVNFVLITRTMVELAGKFSKVDVDNPRFKMLRKATCHINNGQDVYFADYYYRASNTKPPEILYIKTPHFTNETVRGIPERCVALFNLSDSEDKTHILTPSSLALPIGEYVLTDVWSGEQITLSGELAVTLAPHGSRLFEVNSSADISLFDSNVELSDIVITDTALTATVSYAADCELLLSEAPSSVTFDATPVSFEYTDGILKFRTECKGSLTINF